MTVMVKNCCKVFATSISYFLISVGRVKLMKYGALMSPLPLAHSLDITNRTWHFFILVWVKTSESFLNMAIQEAPIGS